jgi:hypothetical protein
VDCGGNHVCIHKTQIKNIMGGYKNNYLSAMDFLEDLKYIEEIDIIIQFFFIEERAIVIKYSPEGKFLGVTDIYVPLD